MKTHTNSNYKLPCMLMLGLSLTLYPLVGSAHTPLFDCFDNGDDTITCEGGYSDGASAEGVEVSLVDPQGKILQQGKLDAASSIIFTRPDTEYSVVFGADRDHSITVLGDEIY